jgi:hypothetical protein
MNTYDVVVLSKEYRTVQIDAENEEEAREKAFDTLDNILNRKAEDYDTDVYVEGLAYPTDETRSYGPQGARPCEN